jgi:ribonuclease H / adenosylcobalamin/alpha-ribazole phosphatase
LVDSAAALEVRLDSKLVVEQLSGRWKIKHQDLKPLALEARRLTPPGTVFKWIPREQNAHADRLANEALDGTRSGVALNNQASSQKQPQDVLFEVDAAERMQTDSTKPGWSHPATGEATLILVRHGDTDLTAEKRFSGGLASANPSLNELGRDQALMTAAWLDSGNLRPAAIVASPVARAWESAELLSERLGLEPLADSGLAELEFGSWDTLTFEEVSKRYPDDLNAWLNSFAHQPGGGESFLQADERVSNTLSRLLAKYLRQTIVVVSHVTPIKLLIARALGVPIDVIYRMELRPGSVSVVTFFLDSEGALAGGSLRLFNALPQDRFTLGW